MHSSSKTHVPRTKKDCINSCFLNTSFQIGGSKDFHGDLLHRPPGNFPITAHCPSTVSPIDAGIFSVASVQIHPQLLSWSPGAGASKKAQGKNATSHLCPLSFLTGAPEHNHSVASGRSHSSFPACWHHQEFQMEVKDMPLLPVRGSFRRCGMLCVVYQHKSACGPLHRTPHPWLLDSSNILLCEPSLANASCLQNLWSCVTPV